MNIAIWGMGVSGLSALKFLSNLNHNLYVINAGEVSSWNNLEEILKYAKNENCFSQNNIPKDLILDQIVLSPGIDRKSQLVASFINKGVEVIGEVELAYRNIEIPIIAITGTNGKTSTATMMDMAFKKAGKKVFLGGNIGVPFCEILNEPSYYDLAVIELSSFQLESIVDFHAKVAVILNISPSHMERYNSFEDYEKAKFRITLNQAREDLFICPPHYLGIHSNATKTPLQKIEELDLSTSKLLGEHHKENLYAVYRALVYFKIENAKEIVQQVANKFEGVKFRLQNAGVFENIQFVNDAKSTNVDATLSAVDSLSKDELYLIIGGKLRSDDVSFVNDLKKSSIKKIYAIGESALKVNEKLNDCFDVEVCKELEDVFNLIRKDVSHGVVLFSPAFPSFDQYKNYIERGEHFKKLVEAFCN